MERQQQKQKLWRKAATSILSIHHNIAVVMAFCLIFVLTIQWLLLDKQLQELLTNQSRSYGYQIADYAVTDIAPALQANDKAALSDLLNRLAENNYVLSSSVFDGAGSMLAESAISTATDNNLNQQTITLLYDIEPEQGTGTLKLVIDKAAINTPIEVLLNQLSMQSLAIILTAVILAWFIAARLTQPIKRLLNFYLNDPDEAQIENLDITSELKLLLETSDQTLNSPAPVSSAEDAGIHHLLAADSVADNAEVICLDIQFENFAEWLNPKSGTPNVHLLRSLDRILILTVHSQQGHLLNFSGSSAEACFALDGNIETAGYRAVCCALILQLLLEDLGLKVTMQAPKETRLMIRHLKRTPVAIALEQRPDVPGFESQSLLLSQYVAEDAIVKDHFQLISTPGGWYEVHRRTATVETLIDRQLSWIQYLLKQE